MKKIIFILIAMMLMSTSILAQKPHRGLGDRHFQEANKHFEDKMFERGRNYERLRIKKMVEFLELDEATADTVIPIIVEDRRNHRKLQNERRNIVKRLAGQIKKDELNEQRVNTLLEQLNENETNQQISRKQFLDEVRTHLSMEQFAKMIVFEERFNQRLIGKMRQMGKDRGRHFDNEDEEI